MNVEIPPSGESEQHANALPALPHPAELPEADLLAACEVKRTRASGPGGQHRNKVETAVVIRHLPTGVIGQASEARSQESNRQNALLRLRINLALAYRCNRVQPSQRWENRTRKGRLSVSRKHDDFAPLLAEALDVVSQNRFEMALAADQLSISTSQLVKFLKQEPPAFEWVNQQRQHHGMGRLR